MIERQSDRQPGCIHAEIVATPALAAPPVSFLADGHRARLLRGPGRRARRERRRDQARLPQLAQHWHPDVNTDRRRQERFKELNEAYQVLSDPQRRQAYDMFGRAGVGGGAGGAGGFDVGVRGFGDIFDAFFGGAAARRSARRGRPRPARTCATTSGSPSPRRSTGPRRRSSSPRSAAARPARAPARSRAPSRRPAPSATAGRDPVGPPDDARPDGQRQRLPALPAARARSSRSPATRATARAASSASGRSRVAIPAGIDEGHQIRLSSEGEVGPRGGPPGSLYVAVHVQPHPVLKRDGTELYYEPRSRSSRPRSGRRHDPDGRRRGVARDQARDPARRRDPAAGQGRAPSPAGEPARRPPRVRRRHRADQAHEAQRELLEGLRRRRPASRSRHGSGLLEQARTPWLATTGDGRGRGAPRREGLARAGGRGRPRGGRGGQRDPRPRRRPAGRRVEPAFELVDEGLGARRRPQPAGDRAGLHPGPRPGGGRAGRRPRSPRRSATSRRSACVRSGTCRPRVVHEDDWADAWKAHFPVLRVGRRLVIRPTWRRHRRAPDDVVIALDPGMAFGTGLHPTTRLCLAGVEASADRGPTLARRRRVLDVGCGSGILAIAAVRSGPASAVGVDTDPIAIEATARQRPPEPRSAGASSPARAACRAVSRRSTSSSPTSSPRCSSPSPAGLRRRAPAGRARCSRRASSSTARREVRAAFAAAGLAVDRRSAEGDWVALEAVRRGA